MGQTIELADVVTSALDVVLQGVWTSLPGRIESYDALTQTATVAAGVKNGFVGEDGDRETHDIPVFNAVPVLHHGGGGFRTTYPVKAGDYVLLVILSRDRGAWQMNGGVGQDGGDDRRHHLSDAVAITGLRPYAALLTDAPNDRMSIGSDTGASIEIDEIEVRVGGNTGTQPTIMADAYRAGEDTYFSGVNVIIGLLNTFVAALIAATPTLTGPPPTITAYNAAVTALAGAATNFGTAVSAFAAGTTTYKTTIARVL